MIEIENIHATCIDYKGCGVLIIGPSGSGKSDLALRMIMDKGASLVADDRTDLACVNGRLQASYPEAIAGLIEVRGLGVCRFAPCPQTMIDLVVELLPADHKIERLPEPEISELMGIKIPKIRLHGFENSAIDKIILACYQNK